MKNKCVHIIIRDKFTQGYISFFDSYSFEWNHIFITFEGEYPLKNNVNNIYVVKDYKEIVEKYGKILDESDRIVVASFFDQAAYLLRMKKENWKKTYIQFWGGDIYRFKVRRETLIHRFKQFIMKQVIRKCIKLCAGVLTLVKGDYDVLKEVFNLSNKNHLVVQVPDDFYELNHIDYSKLIYDEIKNKPRILIGNSATAENRHLEILDIIHEKAKDTCDIIVPLSYGDFVYREKVIKKGRELFGDSFIPLLDYMNRDQYIRILSSCDVAIFNNNRQQATGNIILLANLKKKVYLRNDTTMWNFFKENGFIFNEINEICNETIQQLLTINQNHISNNLNALKKMELEAIEEWKYFYEHK